MTMKAVDQPQATVADVKMKSRALTQPATVLRAKSNPGSDIALGTSGFGLRFNEPESMVVMVTRGNVRQTVRGRKLYRFLSHRSQAQLQEYLTKQANDWMEWFENQTEEVKNAVKMPNYEFPTNKYFTCNISEIKSFLRSSDKTHQSAGLVDDIRVLMNQLQSTRVVFTTPVAENRKRIPTKAFNLLSEIDTTGEIIKWSLPPSINNFLLDTMCYAQLDMENIFDLKSFVSMALYEICNKYKDSPQHKTCIEPPEFWISAFSTKSIEDGQTNQTWSYFKPKCLKAIEEINLKTDIDIELITTGGKYSQLIQFDVRRKKQGKVLVTKEQLELYGKASPLGVSETDINQMMKNHTGAAVDKALSSLSYQLARNKEPIANKVAYLYSILNSNGDVTIVKKLPYTISPTLTQTQPSVNTPSPSFSITEEMKCILHSMSDDDKNVLSGRLLNTLKLKNNATPNVIASLESNKYSGLIYFEAIAMLATDKYGPDWNPIKKEGLK